MGKTKSQKIDAKKSKAATPSVNTPAETGKKPKKVSGEDVLAIMQKLAKNGIKEFTSRQISDKLEMEPDSGRQRVRSLMKQLEKAGKVVIEQKAVKEKGAWKRYTYRLKESK